MKGPSHIKNDYLWAAFWLGLLVVVFFLPVIAGRQMLFDLETTVYSTPSGNFYELPGLKTGWRWGGISYIEAPQTYVGVNALREGAFPLWSPFAATGYPLAAALTSAWYFPLKLLVFFLSPASLFATFDFYFILRIFLAGFGMFLFLKELRISRGAALLGAIAYMFSGHLIVNLMNWWVNVVIVFPYVLFAFERYFRTQEKKYMGLAGIFLALLVLGGQPQTALIDGLFLVLYFLYRLFSQSEWRMLVRRYFTFAAISIALALLIALPMIIDFSVFFASGHNVHENDPQVFRKYEPLQMLYFLVSPTMFLEFALFGRIEAASHPIIFQYYSLVVALLALLGLFAFKKEKLHYFFIGYAALTLLKYAGLPPLSWLAYIFPFDRILWLEHDNTLFFTMAALGAFGYEKLKSAGIHLKKFLSTVVGIPLLFILAALFARGAFLRLYLPNFDLGVRRAGPLRAFQEFLEKLPDAAERFILGFLENEIYFVYALFGIASLFGGLLVILVWRYHVRRSHAAYVAIAVLLAVELFVYMPKIRDGGFKRWDPFPRHPAIEFLEKEIGGKPVRMIGAKDVIPPQIPSVFGLQDFRTNEAIVLERYGEFARRFLFLAHYPDYQAQSRRSPEKPDIFVSNTLAFDESDWTPDLHRFLDMANIKYVVSEASLARDPDLKEVFREENLIVYENATVLPRAYVVHQASVAETLYDAAAIVERESFDYRRAVVVDGVSNIAEALPIEAAPRSEAEIVSYAPREVVVRTDAPAKGLLVLGDAFYPGWRAYVDGERTNVYPANVLFRAVAVPEGAHEVRFVYRPWWIYVGFGISLLTLIGIAIVSRKAKDVHVR